MKRIAVIVTLLFPTLMHLNAQAPAELLEKIRAKVSRVKDYQA